MYFANIWQILSKFHKGINDEVALALQTPVPMSYFLIFILITTYVIVMYNYYDKIPTAADPNFVYNTDECPICIGEFCTPIRLQCGHLYCLQCISDYFSFNRSPTYKCALCFEEFEKYSLIENYTDANLTTEEITALKKNLDRVLYETNKKRNKETFIGTICTCILSIICYEVFLHNNTI